MKKITSFAAATCLLWGVSLTAANNGQVASKLSTYTQFVLKSYQNPTQTRMNASQQNDFSNLFTEINGKTYLESFIRFNKDRSIAELENMGVIFQTTMDGIATCLIPVDKVEEIAGLQAVTGIESAQPAYARLDSVRKCSNITPIHSGQAPLTQAYTGSGVIVGVVDEGFDYTHANYYDQSGTTYRVQSVWNQNLEGTPPSGYSTGTEYTTQSTILAAKTDNNSETHGTHTSGIAAGGGYLAQYKGVAPGSDIVLVATNMTTTGIVNGVQYIMEKATAASKPCVINLSLGSEIGPHDGTSAADQMMAQMIGPGKVIVGAAGNSGSSAIHLQKSFTGVSGDSIATFLSPSVSNGQLATDIWGRNNAKFSVKISIYNTSSGKYTATTGPISVATLNNPSYTLTTSNNTYTVLLQNQLYAGNGDYNSLAIISAQSFIMNEYVVITVTMPGNESDVVNMWANNGTFISNNVNGYTSGDTDYTVGEIGGVGSEIISVGAYCTKNNWTTIGGAGYTYNPVPALYQIASFSSKGPTADGRIKPDITAPGFGVVSGYNSWDTSYGSSNTGTVASKVLNSRTYYWGIDQGTSMACPVITGTVALWLQANPTLTPTQIKNIFSTSAMDPSVTRTASQSNTWGWGKLDAYAGIQQAIALATNIGKEEVFENSVMVTPNPTKGFFRITAAKGFKTIILTDLSGRSVMKQEFGEPVKEYEVDLDQVNAGIYMLQIISPEGNTTSKVIVE